MDGAKLNDMHCHLDFADDAREVAQAFAAAGAHAFSCSVTPAGYERARVKLAGCENVRVGLGMHPWWVADGRVTSQDAERFAELARGERYIGEVGLDFGKRHEHARDVQLRAFGRVVDACKAGGKLVSLHAVRAADTVMDLLEQASCLDGNNLVFHWFSGSSPELTRAIRAGFYFSVNSMMLSTKRGREYLKAIPADKLLLETDLPEEDAGTVGYERFRESLEQAAHVVVELRGLEALTQAAETTRRVLQPR